MKMRRNPHRNSICCLLALAIFLPVWVACAQGAPTIDVQIGFGGHVVPERYAPFHLRIRGDGSATGCRIIVTQPLGSEWRDTATVRQELALVIGSDGACDGAVPVYEPLNPISVALIDGAGAPVAETLVDLRETRHLSPFPLLYGILPYPMESETPPVTAADLPTRWWAYDAVRILWISAPPPQQAWAAITQWVLSGGSVVIVCGPDYFRFDTPDLRPLLPLAELGIETAPSGQRRLSGTPRPGASILVDRGDIPLLVGWRYGVGHVAVVTGDPDELTPDEFAAIAQAVPDATRLSMTAVSETLLEGMPVGRPTHLAGLLLIVLSGFGLAAATWIGRRRRSFGGIVAVCLFIVLAVLAGLKGNEANQSATQYAVSTSLVIIDSLGIQIVSLSIFSMDPPPRTYPFPGEGLPAQASPTRLPPHPLYSVLPQPSATPWAYAHTAEPGQVTTSTVDIGQKSFYTYAPALIRLRLTYDPNRGLAVLDNQLEERLVDGWLIAGGRAVHVPDLPRGTQSISLDAGATLASLLDQADDPAPVVVQHLIEDLPLQHGVWLVAVSAYEEAETSEPGRKVRHLGVYAVKGDVS